MDYPHGAEFESSDTNVYFVKAGHLQLRAADKQLQEMEKHQTVAQAAVAVQTMAATGPLSKVNFILLSVLHPAFTLYADLHAAETPWILIPFVQKAC